MDLWQLFPGELIRVPGIMYLPFAAALLYLYACYALFRYAGQRIALAVFLLLSLLASVIMLYNLRPQHGDVIPPLALLAVMALPLYMVLANLAKKAYAPARMWGVVTLAGWSLSLGWYVWLLALARS